MFAGGTSWNLHDSLNKGLLLVQSGEKQDKQFLEIEKALDLNNQMRLQIPKGIYSLQRSISKIFYFSTSHYQRILDMEITYFENLIKNKVKHISFQCLSNRLQIFNSNYALFTDFKRSPHKNSYDKVHLEIISLLFQVRTIVYEVDGVNLNSSIINNKFEHTIELLKVNNHYDVVLSKKKFEKISFVQTMLLDILSRKINLRWDKDRKKNNFINFEYDLLNNEDDNDDISTYSKEKDNYQSRKHKRSISESMNHFGESIEDFKFLHSYYINKDKSELFNLLAGKTSESNENQYFNPTSFLKNEPIKKEIISPLSPNENMDIFSQNMNDKKRDEEFIKNSLKFLDGDDDYKIQKPPGLELNSSSKNSQSSSVKKAPLKKNEEDTQLYEHKLPFRKNQSDEQQGENFSAPRKPIILDEGNNRYLGKLKFFDETKNFGFIVMDNDGSDVFVHYDDLLKSGFDKEYLKCAKNGTVLKFSFSCMSYIGRYNKSRKAVDIALVEGPSPK